MQLNSIARLSKRRTSLWKWKINDNTIRVLLENEDLTERGITVLDLLGNQSEIESFFFSILDEVDKDHEFRNNEAVTFQLMPNRNGLELLITKSNPSQNKPIEDSIKMMIQKIMILMILTTVPRTAMSLRMSWLITYAVS